MAGNKRPRKKYRPRSVEPFGLSRRYDGEAELRLQLVPHLAFESLRSGQADDSAWHTLACRLNWGMELAHRHHSEAMDVMAAALTALAGIWRRHERTRRWGFTGEEYRAVGDGLNTADELQRATTRKQQMEALEHVLRVAGVRSEQAGELIAA